MASLKQPALIFDFDDTLVCSHQLFLQAQREFCQRMQKLGLYDEQLLKSLEARDIANVEAAGYLADDCFARAMEQTYIDYCQKFDRTPEQAEQECCTELGYQPYLLRPEEMPGARALLDELCVSYNGYRRLLFTQGSEQLQRQRVEASGFAPYFNAIKIVRIKDIAALSNLLREQQVETRLSWYIGNSLRADVNPAIALGLNAVHLDIDSWSYEHQEPGGAYHTIRELRQFTELLRQ